MQHTKTITINIILFCLLISFGSCIQKNKSSTTAEETKSVATDTLDDYIPEPEEEVDKYYWDDPRYEVLMSRKEEHVDGWIGKKDYEKTEIIPESEFLLSNLENERADRSIIAQYIDGIDYILNYRLDLGNIEHIWGLNIFNVTYDEEMPFQIRTFPEALHEEFENEFKDNEERRNGASLYLNLVETALKKRMTLDFYNVYINSKTLIKYVISQYDYDKYFRDYVKRLILMHDVLYAHENPSPIFYEITELQRLRMYNHNNYKEYQAEFDGESYYTMRGNKFKELFEKDLNNELYLTKNYSDEVCSDDVNIFYDTSFWLRRFYEGNTETVYKTLVAVDKDFTIKEEAAE